MKWAVVICGTVFGLIGTNGQMVRQANTTTHFSSEALPPASGDLTRNDLFGGALTFDHPVAVRSAPGDPNHLYVVERVGRIIVVDLNSPSRKVFLDITDRVTASLWDNDINNRRGEGLTSIEFHPNFQQNGRFFVTYTFTPDGTDTNWYNRLSEFRASDDRLTGLPDSEIPYITQFDRAPGHNINDAHFGPDGYLYVAIGDEGDLGTGDDLSNAQKIDLNFFSTVMRIDVDKRPGNLAPNPHPSANTQYYSIPADNPFVGATSFDGKSVDPSKVRTEFWAVGFRNAWRISFDPLTGEMYEGDVGQHTREEINHVVKGGNYGWSFLEGTVNGPKGPPPEGLTFNGPLWDYSTGYGPFEGMCVTGGVVYRGARIPQLYGNLIFADYASGNVWALNVDQNPVGQPIVLLNQTGIAGFGYDPRNGDVLLVDHDHGIIWRIDISGGSNDSYPYRLSDSGIFSDLSTLTPNPGIVPYDVNVPFWSDGAIKSRWFSVPDGQRIQFSANGNWTFPPGSIWVKHFDLEVKAGDPSTAKRIETRVLVKTRDNVYGLSYIWDDAGQNALLVGEDGESKDFTVTDSSGTHLQTWRFPSRAECLQCHTPAAGFVLGFTTAQLNRSEVYGQLRTNQIGALAAAGYLDNAPQSTFSLPALAPADDESISRTYRVRSYFAANCSQCHQPSTGVQAAWDARLGTTLPNANIINGNLYTNPNGDDRVIVPGSLDHSALFRRISVNDKDRMPPLASNVLDQQAIALLSDWITQDLPNYHFLTNDPPLVLKASPQNDSIALSFTQPPDRGVLIESTENIQDPVWQLLQVPDNVLVFPSQPNSKNIVAPLDGSPERYYRLRVTEP